MGRGQVNSPAACPSCGISGDFTQGRFNCMTVAGIQCILMPFGTILGVFTIIVLTRGSVKELFSFTDRSPGILESRN